MNMRNSYCVLQTSLWLILQQNYFHNSSFSSSNCKDQQKIYSCSLSGVLFFSYSDCKLLLMDYNYHDVAY